jgi:hypothetical protein
MVWVGNSFSPIREKVAEGWMRGLGRADRPPLTPALSCRGEGDRSAVSRREAFSRSL